MKHSPQVMAFLADLMPLIAGELRHDAYSRALYSTDASIYQVWPHAVLLPRHEEDIQTAVELAARHQIPLLPRGGGSSLAGQAVNAAVVIDTSRYLDQILEVNVAERWARVRPGVVLDSLNLHLKPWGLQFGPDPASSNRATLGGIVGNNSTGSHSILYGMTADHVLETKVILSDGRFATFGPHTPSTLAQACQRAGHEGQIYRQLVNLTQTQAEVIRRGTPHHWRRCGGYNLDRLVSGVSYAPPLTPPPFNLSQLMVGSEGTLAVITEIKLNLVPRPKMTALAIVHFNDLPTALAATPVILQVNPSAVELLDHLCLTMCAQSVEFARLLPTFVEGQPHSLLITEFYGETHAELEAKITQLRQHLRREGVPFTTIVPALEATRQQNVWAVRKAGLGLLMSLKGDYKPIPFIEDAAVPIAHLADYVAQVEAFCRELGTDLTYYGHASAGCLHLRPLINTKAAQEVAKLPQISQFAMQLVGQYGGAWSSEHGDGRARSSFNEAFFGPDLYQLYRQVKQIFDPQQLLNPGNIVNASPMTDNLRYGAGYKFLPIQEQLDFSPDLGLAGAVEMCNGAAVCRKTTTGTMCPSYMVTKDEAHSTRGRANALRAVLSGQLDSWTSPRLAEVFDLCLSCKACKAECPSSVDMAKLKLEFLSHFYAQHGTPLRARLWGDVAFWSRLSSGLTAPFVNSVLANGFVKEVLAAWLKISPQRSLPLFAVEPFTRWFQRRPVRAQARRVALFVDTFHNYSYPQVAIAATEVLEALGFQVEVVGQRCCGRPMLSQGLVNAARRSARYLLDSLWPFTQAGIPIVGLEPSCLLALRDDYHYILPQDERVKHTAANCYLFEEFLAQAVETWPFKTATQPILLHGHCHQKALVGTAASKQVLTWPGHTVTEVDSGCCGMAGAFGYEAEHYEMSLAMGERRLLPAVRSQPAGTWIVATGVSCRQQIQHGTGRLALHPAEVLNAALRGS